MTKLRQKSLNKYTCESCYYSTSRKSDYKKHLSTHKHKIVTNNDNFATNVAENCDNFDDNYVYRKLL